MNCEEINVSAPWGHIAVKLWGNQQNPAVLMFHGLLDNAATFDRILQFLPQNYYYISVDLPGHGKSSHWPSMSTMNTIDNLLVFQVIVKYFKREKYILLGHSFGGQLAHFYTQLYPDRVEKLIILDVVFFIPIPPNKIKNHLLYTHKSYFATMEKLQNGKLPEYTYEEALEKICSNRIYGKLTEEAAKPILDRMITRHENGKISFTFDQRLKFVLNPFFSTETMNEFVKTLPVECPMLIILSSHIKYHNVDHEATIEILKSRTNVNLEKIKGGHHAHSVDPKSVAPIITNFLLDKSKL